MVLMNPVLRERMGELNRKHLPWREFRYRVERDIDGLSVEEFWAVTRTIRGQALRPFGLTTPDGVDFSYAQPEELLANLHRMDTERAGRLASDEREASAPAKSWLLTNLREEAISSSMLEGATTTRREAREMLRENRAPRDASERMIVNNYNALRWVLDNHHDELTLDALLELHRVVVEGTVEDGDEGRLRRPDEPIFVRDGTTDEILHEPPDATLLQPRLEVMVEFANGEDRNGFVHPLVRAMLLHFWLAWEHPFVDGNGRTARALFYWSALRSGYWVFEYLGISRCIQESRAQYRDAFLDTELDQGDATYFLLYHARMMGRALDRFEEYYQRKMKQQRRSIDLLRAESGLNHRQIALLQRAIREPDTLFTFASHRNSHGVAYATARADLLDLAERGLLTMQSSGRRHVFLAAPDLSARLTP